MREFKTASLADQVFEKLENDIIQGVYPKGEILTELKLVDQLGVSRTPIREALPAATITAPQVFSFSSFRAGRVTLVMSMATAPLPVSCKIRPEP